MFVDLLTDLATLIGGVLLPAYSTYKSLRQKASTNRLIWLRYWVVFGFYRSTTSVTDLLFYWVPLYGCSKILMLLWLSSSKAAGAQIVFNFVVVPLLRDREASIDKKIADTKKQIAIYFWKAVTSSGINWSSLLGAALKSGIGMAASFDSDGQSQNDQQQASRGTRDNTFSDGEDMMTDEEQHVVAVSNLRPTSPTRKSSRKVDGRNPGVTNDRANIKDEDD